MKEPNKISSREVTDPAVYFNRRNFIRAGILAASAVATGVAYRRLNPVAAGKVNTADHRRGSPSPLPATANAVGLSRGRAGDLARGHHALQQFLRILDGQGGRGAGRGRISTPKAGRCRSRAWSTNRKVFDLDDLLKISPPEERIYRMRCVEAWSMVIPWVGFSLSKLLDVGRAVERREVCRL